MKYTVRLAKSGDKAALIEFINLNWGEKHPIINYKPMFNYYYMDGENLHFAILEYNNNICAVCGFIKANSLSQPDVWASFFVADKKQIGAGMELMHQMPDITNARVFACNNIKSNTLNMYEFIGWKTGRMTQYYRMNEAIQSKVAVIRKPQRIKIQQTSEDIKLIYASYQDVIENKKILKTSNLPYKDNNYIKKRYFDYPFQKYDVYIISVGNSAQGLLVVKNVKTDNSNVMRIVDYIGETELLSKLGNVVEQLMLSNKAEYVDCYCAGISDGIFEKMGFTKRQVDDENIIPTLLEPVLVENIDYYYFTNQENKFVMFKADGDQDRPNINSDKK